MCHSDSRTKGIEWGIKQTQQTPIPAFMGWAGFWINIWGQEEISHVVSWQEKYIQRKQIVKKDTIGATPENQKQIWHTQIKKI